LSASGKTKFTQIPFLVGGGFGAPKALWDHQSLAASAGKVRRCRFAHSVFVAAGVNRLIAVQNSN